MDKIIVNLQLFVMQHQVYIYEKGKCTSFSIKSSITELPKQCYDLCKQYNIHNLVLHGQHFAADKIKQELKATKYQNFDIDVEIITN